MEVLKYVGLSYEQVDCWDLAVMFYKLEMEVDIGYVVSKNHPKSNQDREVLINTSKGDFHKVEKPESGDLVLIKFGGFETHIAIYIGKDRILHSIEGLGVVVERLRKYRNLISGFYRHKEHDA